jgi:predicted HD phosphohydrolase
MTKTVAMMQPYWFPYLGYFQLIHASDVFVLGDDLQYVTGGWINRNRMLSNGEPMLFSLPLKKFHSHVAINQRELSDNVGEMMNKLLRTLSMQYSRAPYRQEVMALLQRLMLHPEKNLARYLEHSLRELCAYLGITTPIVRASDLPIHDVQDKQDRVIKTARCLDADLYLNAIGGMALYDADYFSRHGMQLRFHRMDELCYTQFRDPFVANLSIIDVLMFNSVERVRQFLPCFSSLKPQPSNASQYLASSPSPIALEMLP